VRVGTGKPDRRLFLYQGFHGLLEVVAMVVTVLAFFQMQKKRARAHAVEFAEALLGEAPEVFYAVNVHAAFADVGDGVIRSRVLVAVEAQLREGAPLVGINSRLLFNDEADYGLERARVGLFNYMRIDDAVTLQDAYDLDAALAHDDLFKALVFVVRQALYLFEHRACALFVLAAEERLIDLDVPKEARCAPARLVDSLSVVPEPPVRGRARHVREAGRLGRRRIKNKAAQEYALLFLRYARTPGDHGRGRWRRILLRCAL
jgi:hypothetical protein